MVASNLQPQDALPSLAVAMANGGRALIYKIHSHRHCRINRSSRTASASTHGRDASGASANRSCGAF